MQFTASSNLRNQRRRVRGNILFLILLAVVLFAALSYAVTQSLRGGGKDASTESVSTKTSEMLNFFAQIDAAVQRMMMTGGLKDYEINFRAASNVAADNAIVGANDNSNCTTSNCRVFDPAGGNIPVKQFAKMFYDPAWTNQAARILLTSVNGAGTSLPDLVMAYYQVNMNVCNDINARIGVTGPIIGASSSEGNGALLYYSAYPAGNFASSTNSIAVPATVGSSQSTFCICADTNTCGTNSITWYPMVLHVVLQR